MHIRILASVLVRALPVVGPFLRRRDLRDVRLLMALAEIDLLRAQVSALQRAVSSDMSQRPACRGDRGPVTI
jgi:hypothetical protein